MGKMASQEVDCGENQSVMIYPLHQIQTFIPFTQKCIACVLWKCN